jgi:hypothetical protein
MKKNAGTVALHPTHLLAVKAVSAPACGSRGCGLARRHGDHVRVGAELARNPRRLVLAREVVAPEALAVMQSSAPGREQGQLGAAWAAATRALHSAAPSAATAAHTQKKCFQPAKEAESPPAKEARGTLARQTWPRSGRGSLPQQID